VTWPFPWVSRTLWEAGGEDRVDCEWKEASSATAGLYT